MCLLGTVDRENFSEERETAKHQSCAGNYRDEAGARLGVQV